MLAEHTRVCAYDRAGIAWSDPVDRQRSAQNEADEFAALLDALGEKAPVILLAWSGGGPVAQIFAADHPECVAGLILMDAIPPDYELWATQTYPERYPRERYEQLEKVRAFAERAAAASLREEDVASWITPAVRDRYGDLYLRQLLYNPNYWWTYYWQNQYVIASGAQVKSMGSLGRLPLTILVANNYEMGAEPYHQHLGRMWREQQYAQARLSTEASVVPVAAGHAIFRERPRAVIDAVLDMKLSYSAGDPSLPRVKLERDF
jgi:pimeloyl-ACP methyl ester carboxylesterase